MASSAIEKNKVRQGVQRTGKGRVAIFNRVRKDFINKVTLSKEGGEELVINISRRTS